MTIAIEASLTGHLVVSTIHTNSAAETITRVLNMGIQAFLIPASFNAIIAQRLVRRLCQNCKKPLLMSDLDLHTRETVQKALAKTAKEELIRRVPKDILAKPTFYQPIGCPECDNLGYKGRV